MNKINTIIEREYTTRVKNKSFIIMSILGPLIMVAIMLMPTMLANIDSEETKIVAVVDSTHIFNNQLPETEDIKFVYMPDANLNKYKSEFSKSGFYALLYISHVVVNSDNAVILYSDKTPSLGLRTHIASSIEKKLETEKLRACGVDPGILSAVKTDINISSVRITEDGHEEEDNLNLKMILGSLMGVIIFMAIFLSGNSVMRGVIEEKNNRIIEVMVSSVKPFQLMMGKIIGVGLVALTQFALWIILTFAIYSAVAPILLPDTANIGTTAQATSLLDSNGSQMTGTEAVPENEIFSDLKSSLGSLGNINFTVIILSFLLFFIGGYFLYGAVFASIGSMVENETDTQQFILPFTAPLIIAYVMIFSTIGNPDCQLNFWLSIIPFTSPITMLARIPYGVPYSEIILSAILLIATFVLFTMIAAKIYKTGILMYGKKASLKEVWRWIRQK